MAVLIPILSLPIIKNQVLYAPSPSLPIGGLRFISDELVSFDWSILWFSIYLAGVVISLLLFFIGIYKVLRIIAMGESVTYHDHYIIYTTTDIPLCSFGKYIIAPRHRKGNLTEYELTHEINHLTKYHTLDILFLKVFRSFFWFNPTVLLYERRLSEVHEYQADNATIDQLDKDSYLSFIIEQVSVKSKHSLVHNFNSLIKKRLIMMNSESRSGSARYLAILPVLLVVLSLFSFDTYPEYVYTNGKVLTIFKDTVPDVNLDTIIYSAVLIPITNGPTKIIDKPLLSNVAVYDTISVFDFTSMTEVSRVVAKRLGVDAYLLPGDNPITKAMYGIDTISSIDYDSYKETMVTINYKTGVIDTLSKEY